MPALAIWALLISAPVAAQKQDSPSLRVTVTDSTGLVVVGASVEVSQGASAEFKAYTDDHGVTQIDDLDVGPCSVRVSSPGFSDTVETVELDSGANHVVIVLDIAGIVDQVTVSRDPRLAATDPNGETLTLGEEELDALPDSPEELESALASLAGPGAEIEVDGFVEGELPPKERIREIRIRRTIFSSDRHRGGRARIEVVTKPGTDQWSGSLRAALRDEALNARNAFASEETPEQLHRIVATLEGPLLRDRTSVSVVVDAGSAFESQVVRAGSPVDPVQGAVTQPRRELKLAAGFRHALTRSQALRVEFRRDDHEEDNLGIGTFDLPERAYSMRSRRSKVAVTNTGSFAGRFVNETRFEGEWRGMQIVPRSDDATVRVLDSVTFGGANIQGGRDEQEFQLDEKLQWNSGPHTLSVGGRFEWLLASSDEFRNQQGTFTFSDQDALQAARPDAFSRLEGNPLVEYRFFTGGLFLQDDIRVSDSFFLGIGLRQEWQSQVDESLNLAPRLGFSWAPTADGRTAVKGGVGVFNDWYDANTYENVLQLDGSHLHEISVQNPGFPDPFNGGNVIVLPDGRVTQAPGLAMPSSRRLTLGVERRVGDEIRLDASYSFREDIDQLRGRNVNAPDASGVRPNPVAGNVIDIDSIGKARDDEVSVGARLRLPWWRMVLASRYTYENRRDDGDGAFSIPADSDHPDEWGPANDDVRHQLSVFAAIDPIKNVRLGLNLRAESAPPYTITTGDDDNGDTVFNDRPRATARNSERGDGMVTVDARLAYKVGFGQGRSTGERNRSGAWRSRHRAMSEVYVRVSNLLNTVAFSDFSGVLSSPFFGAATAARAPRRAEIGTRLLF